MTVLCQSCPLLGSLGGLLGWLLFILFLQSLHRLQGSADSADSADEPPVPDPVRKDLLGFCPYLHELPEAFTTFWYNLHGAALRVEQLGCKAEVVSAEVSACESL